MAAGKSESRIASSRRSTACWASKKPQPVLEITESMLRKDPHDWEALYRQGVALADLDKPDEAARAVPGPARPDDRRRREERDRQGPHPRPQAPGRRRAAVGAQPQAPRCRWRIGSARPCRSAWPASSRTACSSPARATGHGLGAAGLRPGADGGPGLAGQPGREARARRRATRSSRRSARPAEKTPADVRALWDWFYLCADAVRQRRRLRGGQRPEPRRADRSAGPLGLSLRRWAAGSSAWASAITRTVGRRPSRRTTRRRSDKDELDHVLACYRGAASPPARAGPGPDPPERRRRAEAGQAGRRRRAVLSRGRSPAPRSSARSPAPSAWRRERGDVDGADPARSTATSGSRPGRGRSTTTPARSISHGPGLLDRAGHERLRRPQGVRRRPATARPRARGRPAQASSSNRPARARAARARLGTYGPATHRSYQIWVGKTIAVVMQIAFPLPNEYLDDDGHPGPAHGVRALQARRPARAIWSATSAARPRRRQTPADAVYPRLALATILLVERRQGRGDRRVHQGGRGVASPSRTCGSTWPSSWSSRASGPTRWRWPTRSSRSTTRP